MNYLLTLVLITSALLATAQGYGTLTLTREMEHTPLYHGLTLQKGKLKSLTEYRYQTADSLKRKAPVLEEIVIYRFDSAQKATEYAVRRPGGSYSERWFYSYGADHRLREEYAFFDDTITYAFKLVYVHTKDSVIGTQINSGGTLIAAIVSDYNAGGFLIREKVTDETSVVTFTYLRDSLKHTLDICLKTPDSPLDCTRYLYNDKGQKTGSSEKGKTTYFDCHYDELGNQLWSGESLGAFDTHGNWTECYEQKNGKKLLKYRRVFAYYDN